MFLTSNSGRRSALFLCSPLVQNTFAQLVFLVFRVALSSLAVFQQLFSPLLQTSFWSSLAKETDFFLCQFSLSVLVWDFSRSRVLHKSFGGEFEQVMSAFAKQFALVFQPNCLCFSKREAQKWSSRTFKSTSWVKRYLKLRYSEQKRSKNILWKLWIHFLAAKVGPARFVHDAFSIWLTQPSLKTLSLAKYSREIIQCLLFAFVQQTKWTTGDANWVIFALITHDNFPFHLPFISKDLPRELKQTGLTFQHSFQLTF